METTMQILQITITATETVIEGVSGERLIAALQDAFRSLDTEHISSHMTGRRRITRSWQKAF
jgi:uncharacterized protein YqgV (UPF0045/DUF77 family)